MTLQSLLVLLRVRPQSTDSILAGINSGVAKLEQHAASTLVKAEASSAAALAAIEKSNEHTLEAARASRVADKVKELLA